jgi:hypothetical protein
MAPDTQSIDFDASFLTLGLAHAHPLLPFDNSIDHSEYAGSETLSAAIKRVDLDDEDDEDDEDEEEDDDLDAEDDDEDEEQDEDEEDDDEEEDDEEYEDDDDDLDDDEDEDDEELNLI